MTQTDAQAAAVDESRRACAALADAEDALEAAREARRQAWAAAAEAGLGHAELAEMCGVSKPLVKAEIARTRGATWMIR